MTELIASKVQELCARLTERGVEYTIAGHGSGHVKWQANGTEFIAFEHDGALSVCQLGSVRLTPEQAVAATLGSSNCTNGERTNGTCHNVHEPPRTTTFWPSPHFKCSECGATHVSMEYVYFCPNCGAKVVDAEVEP